MPHFAGFSFDEIGLGAGRGPVREWRTLVAIEVAPPLWRMVRGWDVTLFFSEGEPVAFASEQDFLGRERVAALAALLRLAVAAAPTDVSVSLLARIFLESAPAAIDAARIRRDARAAWRAWRRSQALQPGVPDNVSALAMVEETGRCPASVREAWEAELRGAMRDPVILEKVARLYLATNQEMAEPYARMLVQASGASPAIVRGLARWLFRRGRIAEADAVLAKRLGEPLATGEAWGLAADRLALQRYRQSARERWRAHGRRRLRVVGATLATAAAIGLAVFPIWFERERQKENVQRTIADVAERMRRASEQRLLGTKAERRRFAELKIQAGASDVPAMFELSRHYRIGRTTAFDAAEERRWLERAAEAGHVEAQVTLADFLQRGRDGTAIDAKAAFGWFERAAEQGNLTARRRITLAHRRGIGVPRDDALALRLTEELGASGDTWAIAQRAVCHFSGWGLPKDEAAGIAELKRETERDNAYAWANLGSFYQQGRGLARDLTEAARCYENAIRLGDPEAVAALARLARAGTGVPRDEARAEALLREAANADNPSAQLSLALLLGAPARGASGMVEARYWGARAVHENFRFARFSVASLYLRGAKPNFGDAAHARALLQSDAEAGNAMAMSRLASLCRDGVGGPQDGAAALRWWHKAAAANNVEAMLTLASVYEQGDVLAKIHADRAEARRLLEQAAALDSAEAKKRLTALPAARNAEKWQPPADLLENLPRDGGPQVIHQIRPHYPFEMRWRNITGNVVVDFVVAKDGSVVNAYALRSSRAEFEADAVAAVRQWHFKPGTREGKPVDTHMQVPVVFTLDEEPATKLLEQADALRKQLKPDPPK